MNNLLLLLAGLVLVVCLMNSKDLMKSDLVKSVSSKSKSVSKSMGVDSTTLLVVVFVGAVLFMCMNKSVEGLTMQVNGSCPTNTTEMHVLLPDDKDTPIPMCFNNNSEVDMFKDLYETAKKVVTVVSPSGGDTTTVKKVDPS